MTSQRNTPDGPELDQRIRAAVRPAPADPLFTRKVLNRLPPKGRRWCARLEYALSFAALVATALFAAEFFRSVVASGRFEFFDIFPTAFFTALITAETYNLLSFAALRFGKAGCVTSSDPQPLSLDD
ncbi:MAG: hypothetical protein K2F71_00235 [Paramuribaculum sp.]|nr:hypothetical protein [Paramuribaculum sp.]